MTGLRFVHRGTDAAPGLANTCINATIVRMQHSGRYQEAIESVAISRRVLRSQPDQDPVTAAVGASSALLAVATRSVSEILEMVTLSQYRTMVALAPAAQMFSQLRSVMGLDAARLDHELDGLIQGGWVQQLDDGAFCLTPHGVQLVTHVDNKRQAELADILASLPRADRRAVANAFSIFASAAESENPGVGHGPAL